MRKTFNAHSRRCAPCRPSSNTVATFGAHTGDPYLESKMRNTSAGGGRLSQVRRVILRDIQIYNNTLDLTARWWRTLGKFNKNRETFSKRTQRPARAPKKRSPFLLWIMRMKRRQRRKIRWNTGGDFFRVLRVFAGIFTRIREKLGQVFMGCHDLCTVFEGKC